MGVEIGSYDNYEFNSSGGDAQLFAAVATSVFIPTGNVQTF